LRIIKKGREREDWLDLRWCLKRVESEVQVLVILCQQSIERRVMWRKGLWIYIIGTETWNTLVDGGAKRLVLVAILTSTIYDRLIVCCFVYLSLHLFPFRIVLPIKNSGSPRSVSAALVTFYESISLNGPRLHAYWLAPILTSLSPLRSLFFSFYAFITYYSASLFPLFF